MHNDYSGVSDFEGIVYLLFLVIAFIPYIIFLTFICILSGMDTVYRIFIKEEKRQ